MFRGTKKTRKPTAAKYVNTREMPIGAGRITKERPEKKNCVALGDPTWRPNRGWQGTGATLVATNAATQLLRLRGLPKQNYILRHLKLLQKCSLCGENC